MLYTPKKVADLLVKTYGNTPTGSVVLRDEFEKQAERYGVDHRLVRSVDLELRPMGYILFDLLKERKCIVMMSISMVMEALAQEDIKRAG